jgi:hypothetical protein
MFARRCSLEELTPTQILLALCAPVIAAEWAICVVLLAVAHIEQPVHKTVPLVVRVSVAHHKILPQST